MRASQLTTQRKNIEEQEQIEDIKGQEQRVTYLRRVYGFLFLQLAFAFFLVKRAESSAGFRTWVSEWSSLTYYTSLIFFIFIQVLLVVLPSFYSRPPFNWLAYLINAVSFGFLATYLDVTQTNTQDLVCAVLRYSLFGVFGLFAHSWTTKFELTFQQTSYFLLGGIYTAFLYQLIFTQISQYWALALGLFTLVFLFVLVWDYETIFSNNLGNFQVKDTLYGASSVYANVVLAILRVSELLKNVIISGPKTA